MSETWTPIASQAETWTNVNGDRLIRVFSVLVFSRRPIFDTGPSAGIWDNDVPQNEIWTPK